MLATQQKSSPSSSSSSSNASPSQPTTTTAVNADLAAASFSSSSTSPTNKVVSTASKLLSNTKVVHDGGGGGGEDEDDDVNLSSSNIVGSIASAGVVVDGVNNSRDLVDYVDEDEDCDDNDDEDDDSSNMSSLQASNVPCSNFLITNRTTTKDTPTGNSDDNESVDAINPTTTTTTTATELTTFDDINATTATPTTISSNNNTMTHNRNKRKNFQPRCISDNINDDNNTSTKTPTTTTGSDHIDVNDQFDSKLSYQNTSSMMRHQPSVPVTQSSMMAINNSNTNNIIQNNNGSNNMLMMKPLMDLLTNSSLQTSTNTSFLITKLINDLQQQQQQQVTPLNDNPNLNKNSRPEISNAGTTKMNEPKTNSNKNKVTSFSSSSSSASLSSMVTSTTTASTTSTTSTMPLDLSHQDPLSYSNPLAKRQDTISAQQRSFLELFSSPSSIMPFTDKNIISGSGSTSSRGVAHSNHHPHHHHNSPPSIPRVTPPPSATTTKSSSSKKCSDSSLLLMTRNKLFQKFSASTTDNIINNNNSNNNNKNSSNQNDDGDDNDDDGFGDDNGGGGNDVAGVNDDDNDEDADDVSSSSSSTLQQKNSVTNTATVAKQLNNNNNNSGSHFMDFLFGSFNQNQLPSQQQLNEQQQNYLKLFQQSQQQQSTLINTSNKASSSSASSTTTPQKKQKKQKFAPKLYQQQQQQQHHNQHRHNLGENVYDLDDIDADIADVNAIGVGDKVDSDYSDDNSFNNEEYLEENRDDEDNFLQKINSDLIMNDPSSNGGNRLMNRMQIKSSTTKSSGNKVARKKLPGQTSSPSTGNKATGRLTTSGTGTGLMKSIDIEKLKQLQQLHKLNLMQQLTTASPTTDVSSSSSTSTTSSATTAQKNFFESMWLMHQQQQQPDHQFTTESNNKLSTSSSLLLNHRQQQKQQQPHQQQLHQFASNTKNICSNFVESFFHTKTPTNDTSKDNINYVKDLFRNKVINAKSSSSRPLSSWKQSINACGPGPAPWIEKSTLHSLGIQGELINKSGPIDYTQYVKRYANANECGNQLCKELSYREHFHCNALSCNSRVFMKKEEMIRHFKWHKKRDESLTHGFLRCSPSDNCIERFKQCPHHRKQTHYHCLKRGCDKVYISTSDVQMHANYHRKDTAIIQEGFQRFRATENCLLETCTFFGQKTTHFHCRRDNCSHTFKNKADMEKHKSYHIRDEQLARDGFKKFLKHETCTFDECQSSRVSNHIHCIRSGCTQILQNTVQLKQHKRKHERCEKELAYRKYQLAQSIYQSLANNNNNNNNDNAMDNSGANGKKNRIIQAASILPGGINLDIQTTTAANLLTINNSNNNNNQSSILADNSNLSDEDDIVDDEDVPIASASASTTTPTTLIDQISKQLPLNQISTIPIEDILGDISDQKCLKYIQRHAELSPDCNFEDHQMETIPPMLANDPQHLNCPDCNCCWLLDHQATLKHAKKHVIQEEIISLIYEETNDSTVCNAERCLLNPTGVRHYHCRMFGCGYVIPVQDRTLKKYEHYKFHEDLQCTYPLDVYMTSNSQLSMGDSNQSSSSASSSSSSSSTNNHSSNNNSSGKSQTNNNNKSNKIQEFNIGTNNNNNNTINNNIINSNNCSSSSSSINSSITTNCANTNDANNMDNNKKDAEYPPTPLPQQQQQVFPTGTTLLSVDGMPILKRKRGRPPKNRSNELLTPKQNNKNSNSNNDSNNINNVPNVPISSSSSSLSPFDLARLADLVKLPFDHASLLSNIPQTTDELSKTIPIRLIMPSSIHLGFYVFDESSLCSDVTCIYLGQKHYHCFKPRCYYSTNRDDILLEHSKDFHDSIDILENFVYFDEKIDCKSPTCQYNRKNNHFHCTRADCNFSFSRYSMMSSHEEQHFQEKQSNHKLPVQDLNDLNESQRSASRSVEDDNRHYSKNTSLDLKTKNNKIETDPNDIIDNGQLIKDDASIQNSLHKLFFNRANALGTLASTIPSSINLDEVVQQHQIFDETNLCDSPFCKLKRRYHFHCITCNQAFTSYDRLVPHCLKHLNAMFPDRSTLPNELNDNKEFYPNSSVPNPTNLTNEFFQLFLNNLMNFPSTSNPTTNPFPQLDLASTACDSNPNSVINYENCSKRRGSFSSDGSNNNDSIKRLRSDDNNSGDESCSKNNSSSNAEEASPNGYSRFRFNEDCGFASCVYREHQTHFHCMRKDCGYSFCDKTRFVQHTARHERLDTLMGGDFQQFRSSVTCGQSDCIYGNPITAAMANNKTSHFHCLKCEYVCADTNKVVAHRRQHAKMDNISAAGFERYAPNQDCFKEMCNYKLKQTHYHCSTCNYSVLGLSQMASHKQRHAQQQQYPHIIPSSE